MQMRKPFILHVPWVLVMPITNLLWNIHFLLFYCHVLPAVLCIHGLYFAAFSTNPSSLYCLSPFSPVVLLKIYSMPHRLHRVRTPPCLRCSMFLTYHVCLYEIIKLISCFDFYFPIIECNICDKGGFLTSIRPRLWLSKAITFVEFN